ncbi:MAG: hypothetical protein RBS72_22155 [Sedimentisphaerales bacterium]|jgi:probable HAF family extracellular repeat protein|nr:hypothetical protein [Sedimentisphaerales bacterium]HOI35871.1 hypothetical protein [Bacillota bacterium]
MRRHILLVWAVSLLAVPPVFADMSYEVIGLGTLGGSLSRASDINNSNQVVGAAKTINDLYHAFLWEDGVITDLGTLNRGTLPNNSGASAVNDNGQIVGSNTVENDTRGFLYDQGQMYRLASKGTPTAINNSGVIVGYSDDSAYDGRVAVTFQGLQVIDLGIGRDSEAHAINAGGQIVGWVPRQGYHQGFLYDDGLVTYFGPSLSEHTYAYGINNAGQIVGAYDGGAFLYDDGVMTPLGLIGCHAMDINNEGQIVGYGPGYGAYLYDDGIVTSLNPLPGYQYSRAYAINDNGWIIGYSGGLPEANGAFQATLWKPIVEQPEPVPLPGAFLLGSIGLGLSGWFCRKWDC